MKKIVNSSFKSALLVSSLDIMKLGLTHNKKEVSNFKKGSYYKKFFRGMKK